MLRFFSNNNNNSNRIERFNLSFFSIVSSLRREVSPLRTLKCPGHNRVHIMCNTLTLIMCNMSCATWYEGTAQLLRLTELKSHLY